MSLLKLETTRLAAPVPTPRASSPAIWAGAGAVGMLLVVALVLGVSKGGWSWPVGVKAGPRGLVILRESSKDTPAFRALKIQLQSGGHDAYRAEKGHKFLILDVDAKDSQTNQPVKVVEEWKAAIGKTEYPALIITDLASEKILDKRHLPEGSTAEQCIGWLKAKGG